jgi:hypothetical protein
MNLGQQILLKKKVHRLKHKKRNLFFEKRPFILGVGKDAISFSFLKEDSKGALSLKCLPPGLVTPTSCYMIQMNSQRKRESHSSEFLLIA